MKATGIVRRIDDLGRVVIPKEIRRTLRIREGAPLEIYTGADGEVIFKKYSPIGELNVFAEQLCEAIAAATKLSVVICDTDHCVAANNISKKSVVDKRITEELEHFMENRRSFSGEGELLAIEGCDKRVTAASPIISLGDVCGAVVLLENEECSSATETDVKLVSVAADYLGKQNE